ncbi:hypothetical protein [Clostridium kluyveri]|nr:hypothetical protein [Clostridium kluyveri]
MMFDIMLNDIKRFLGKEKKYLLLGIVCIVLLLYKFNLNISRIKNKTSFFQFFMLIILIQAVSYMIGALLGDEQLKDIKFIFTLPISIKAFILGKNFLAIIIYLIQYTVIILLFLVSKSISGINTNDIFKFISALICSISMSNILVVFLHKKEISPTDSFIENLKSAKQSFFQLIIIIPFSVIILFITIKSIISYLVLLPMSIIFYIISLRTLEKKLMNQSSFFEEVEI